MLKVLVSVTFILDKTLSSWHCIEYKHKMFTNFPQFWNISWFWSNQYAVAISPYGWQHQCGLFFISYSYRWSYIIFFS